MKVLTKIQDMRQAIKNYRMASPEGLIGLVPTMGYLHEGHASLMRRASEECGLKVLSLFVNPLQFGPNEDFERYPRDQQRDLQIAEANGVDLVFMPDVQEMYPQVNRTKVLVAELTERLCGASRPGHFDGVGTVVSKLFHIIQPDRAYFGMKDAQQVAVIEQMTLDLNFPVHIVACDTVREADGLALSSRNVYLSSEQREQATVLYRTLQLAEQLLSQQDMTSDKLKQALIEQVERMPLAQIDYIDVLHYPELIPPKSFERLSSSRRPLLVAMAVKFGATRLIDNKLFYSRMR